MNDRINPEFGKILRQIENLHQAIGSISTDIRTMTGHVLIADIVKILGMIKDIANVSKSIQDRFTMLIVDAYFQREQDASRLTRELELIRQIFPNPDAETKH